MSIATLTARGQHIRSLNKSSRLFLHVIIWEWRRFVASRLFWFQAFVLFGFLLFLTWAMHVAAPIGVPMGTPEGNIPFLSGFVAGTSADGLLHILPTMLIMLVLLLPFVTADGVTRDVHRRTHELLMTTALPTWAYVWGRYLAGLVVSLVLALLLLISLGGMGWLLHLTTPDYPAPEMDNLLLLWIGMVVSATILVSSIGFALCTLLPRLSTWVKVVIMVAWLVIAVVLPLNLQDSAVPSGWPVSWDPTSAITALGLLPTYAFHPGQSVTTEAQLQQLILSVENRMPPLAGWFVPHLVLAGVSLVVVLVAALAFKRSRSALN